MKPDTTMELATTQAGPMAISDPESILRYAIDRNADVSVIERMLVVRDKLKSEAAQAAFDQAMSDFQHECPVILKEKGVPDRSGKTAYRYCPLESIEVQIRPLLHKHGFNHTFDTDTASEPGWVIAKCIVTHRAGHSRHSTAKFPLGTRTAIMSETQAYAAALTFANRRALQNAYGLVLAGEDMDGQTGRIKPHGPNALAGEAPVSPQDTLLKKKLVDMTRSVHMAKGYALDEPAKAKLYQWLLDEMMITDAEFLENLAGKRLAEVVAKVEAKLKGAP